MKTKYLFFLIFLIFIFTSCTTKMVDPYYTDKLSCPIDENGFSHCESIDSSYKKIIHNNTNAINFNTTENISYSRKQSNIFYPEIKKGMSNTTKGMLIGSGMGIAGGAWYSIIKKNSKNKVIPILIGALIGGGVGALTGKLIEITLNKERKITSEKYKLIYKSAKNYSDCIYQSLKENKSPEITAQLVEKCSVYIADLPGIGFYKSQDIENMFKLKLQREYLVKKELSRITGKSNIIPLMTPPKIVKVLITPYVDDKNIFHQGENIFVVVDQGKWIIPQRTNLLKEKNSDVLIVPDEVIKKINQNKKGE